MKISLKNASVHPAGMRPELVFALQIVASHWPDGINMTVTSIVDSKHSQTSLHYAGAAIDIRSRNLKLNEKRDLVAALHKRALGNDYDFLLEDPGGPNEHFHLEFQPRRPA